MTMVSMCTFTFPVASGESTSTYTKYAVLSTTKHQGNRSSDAVSYAVAN